MKAKITANVNSVINFAACFLGRVAPVKNICIEADCEELILRVRATPEIFFEYKEEIKLENGVYNTGSVPVKLNDFFYRREINEKKDCILYIEALDKNDPSEPAAIFTEEVHLQPYYHWDAFYKELLPAYMQPNDACISPILKRAGELAAEKDSSLCGYQKNDKYDVLFQARCIFDALQELNLLYFNPPPAFEEAGQPIRTPRQVLSGELSGGTCLDLVLLYASCLEAVGIHSVILLMKGHAMAGFFHQESGSLFPEIITDYEKLSDIRSTVYNLTESGFVPVECTAITHGNFPFENAVISACDSLDRAEDFVAAVDVNMCRALDITPAFSFIGDASAEQLPTPAAEPEKAETTENAEKPESAEPAEEAEKDNEPANAAPETSMAMTISEEGITKLRRLKDQAMDFSMNNRLLNFTVEDGDIPFTVSSEEFLAERIGDEQLNELLKNGDGCENCNAALFAMLKKAKQSSADPEAQAAYIVIDSLKWFPKGQTEAVSSPLYLCPAAIKRNVRGEMVIFPQYEKLCLNPVLKELMLNDYGIAMSIAADKPGEKYAEQLELLKSLFSANAQWEIISGGAAVAQLSMPDEAIYKWLCDEKKMEHDIVHGILNGEMSWNNQIDGAKPDSAYKVYAFPADSTQRAAISNVKLNRAQVLFGPPGTGKSQTIANIIVEAMKDGKKVLFSADKQSARSIIYEKLEELELDPFCFNTDMAQNGETIRRKVDGALRTAADFAGAPVDLTSVQNKYTEAIDALCKYNQFLRENDYADLPLIDLYDEAERQPDIPALFEKDELPETTPDIVNYAYLRELAKTGEQLNKKTNNSGSFPHSPDMFTDILKEDIETKLGRLEMLNNRLDHAAEEAMNALGTTVLSSTSAERNIQLSSYIHQLRKTPVTELLFDSPEQIEEKQRIDKLNEILATLYFGSPIYESTQRELDELNEKMDKRYRENVKNGMPRSYVPLSASPNIYNPKGFSKLELEDKKAHDKFMAHVEEIENQFSERPRSEVKAVVSAAYKLTTGKFDSLRSSIDTFYELSIQFNTLFAELKEIACRVTDNGNIDFTTTEARDLLRKQQSLGKDCRAYAELYLKSEEFGLKNTVDKIEKLLSAGEYSADEIITSLKKSINAAKIREIVSDNGEMKNFDADDFNDAVDICREAEKEIRSAYRKNLLCSIIGTMPNIEKGIENDKELGALQKIIRKAVPADIMIRSMFEQASGAMERLFPCIIMSPEEAASFMNESTPDFDLVIFDEGSQLPTYKALIPISKSKGCMIVGDEKQLVPTSFFSKVMLDEDGSPKGKESILEDAIVTSMPQKMLRFHYRSKYESLISFSNSHYYHNSICTFPSPDIEFCGVKTVLCENSVYDRGGTRTNRAEAEKIVELLTAGVEDGTISLNTTAGVIAMNVEQMKLIQSLVSSAAESNAPFAAVADKNIDIMNLESCQGREWDTVFISAVYGKDENGAFSNNLGPITQDGGGNRLNVMLTRAKKQLVLVTGMTAEMFNITSAGGNSDFRDFLLFANGKLSIDTGADRSELALCEKGEKLIASVSKSIEALGYKVTRNVGSSRAKIDLAVSNEGSDKYLLGIRFDDFAGKMNTRDYEITIPSALEDHGWKLYRLHSASWFFSPESVLEDIKELTAE